MLGALCAAAAGPRLLLLLQQQQGCCGATVGLYATCAHVLRSGSCTISCCGSTAGGTQPTRLWRGGCVRLAVVLAVASQADAAHGCKP